MNCLDKIKVIRNDITSLKVDAICNAAKKTLLGGSGVDGAIHKAAGTELVEECKGLGGCDTGDAKITGGYKLPAKYVIHTVGPIGEQPALLKSCYYRSLELMKINGLKSIAFPCISTGIYGYPYDKAAEVAFSTVVEWMMENAESVDEVIFCTFLSQDFEIYNSLFSDMKMKNATEDVC